MVLGSINGINSATANTNVGIGTNIPNARLQIGSKGGLAIGGSSTSSQDINSTHGQRRSIQISTDIDYGGTYDMHTGYLMYSIMPGGWATAELHICTSNNWAQYNTTTPALRITQTTTYANAVTLTSDKRLKTNIKNLDYGLTEILKISPMSYVKHSAHRDENKKLILEIDGKKEFGFIAQDLFNIMPEIVDKPEDENLSVWGINYNGLIPVLTKAIQELNTKLENEEEKNILLEQKYNDLLKRIEILENK